MNGKGEGEGARISMGRGGEFDLIRELLGPGADLPGEVVLGPGDDCAVLEGGWVLSTDLSVEGVHFDRAWISLEEAGFRAAAGALSDLAAMAARPVGTLVSLALGGDQARGEAQELQKGVAAVCREMGAPILGGDLARSPGPIFLSVTVIGRARNPVGRGGTRPGDEVWVTGHLGGSAGAVVLWQEGRVPPAAMRERFASPRPRIQEALWLGERVSLHGLIDLSDGLAGDAGHLAAAGGLSLTLRENRIPLHPSLLQVLGDHGRCLDLALRGGEDFELCLTVPPGALDEWQGLFQDSFGLPLTRVGRAEAGEGLFLEGEREGRRPMPGGGFDHFFGEEVE